ncbi:protein starmaker-like [Cotesia glomerata]|uniref:protein starmaker-like n=1 Tax=Cotesia glomerata TaxID=32391 RepID=UPI001D018FAE|nr:protein starmaker-like [Cotesia glomerata]
MSRKMSDKIFSLVFWDDLNSHSVIKTSSIKRAIRTGKLTAKKNNKNEAVKILLQDDDKEYLEMVDVDQNGKILLNKRKKDVKKGGKKGEKIKTSRAVGRKVNDEDIMQTKSIFDEDSDEPSSPSSKLRRVTRKIISSDDSELEEERTKNYSKKVSSSTIKPRASNRMLISINSEDEDNEPETKKKVISFKRHDQTNLKQNNDEESRELINVNKYERAVSKVRPRNEETNKGTKAGSVENSPMRNKRNPRSTSPVGFYYGKMSSSMLKQRTSDLVFTSSDEESEPVVKKNLIQDDRGTRSKTADINDVTIKVKSKAGNSILTCDDFEEDSDSVFNPVRRMKKSLVDNVQKGLVQYSDSSDDAEGNYETNNSGNSEVINKEDSEGDSDINRRRYHKVDNKEESESDSDANSRNNDQVANKQTSNTFSKINDNTEEIIILDGQKELNTKLTKKNYLEEDDREQGLPWNIKIDEVDNDQFSAEDLKLFKQFLELRKASVQSPMQVASSTNKQEKVTDNKDERELIKGSEIMVDRYKLRLLTKNYQKKAGQMARQLLRLIIGEENLAEMVPQKEKEGRKLIPQKISNAILSYVNAHVIGGHQLEIDEFQSIMRSLCCSVRNKYKKKLTVKKA